MAGGLELGGQLLLDVGDAGEGDLDCLVRLLGRVTALADDVGVVLGSAAVPGEELLLVSVVHGVDCIRK